MTRRICEWRQDLQGLLPLHVLLQMVSPLVPNLPPPLPPLPPLLRLAPLHPHLFSLLLPPLDLDLVSCRLGCVYDTLLILLIDRMCVQRVCSEGVLIGCIDRVCRYSVSRGGVLNPLA